MSEETEAVYKGALDAVRQGDLAAVVTVVGTRGSTPREAATKMLVYADGRRVGTVGGGDVEAQAIDEARAAMAEGYPREIRCQTRGGRGEMRLFIEVLAPPATLLILGAGHVGQAMAELGAFLGYRVVVVDERDELITPDRFPRAHDLRTGDFAQKLSHLTLNERTYVVIVTPHAYEDERILEELVDEPVAYVGLIGSSRRTAHTFERAREAGVPEAFLDRIHTPIGLDIGADTPREIAVSIMAEIIAAQRQGLRQGDLPTGVEAAAGGRGAGGRGQGP